MGPIVNTFTLGGQMLVKYLFLCRCVWRRSSKRVYCGLYSPHVHNIAYRVVDRGAGFRSKEVCKDALNPTDANFLTL